MSRSKWKGPFIDLKKRNNKNIIISRNSNITPNFVGLSFNVYNGKTYNEILVTKDMVGHKFGEFSFTRAEFVYKKKKNG